MRLRRQNEYVWIEEKFCDEILGLVPIDKVERDHSSVLEVTKDGKDHSENNEGLSSVYC